MNGAKPKIACAILQMSAMFAVTKPHEIGAQSAYTTCSLPRRLLKNIHWVGLHNLLSPPSLDRHLLVSNIMDQKTNDWFNNVMNWDAITQHGNTIERLKTAEAPTLTLPGEITGTLTGTLTGVQIGTQWRSTNAATLSRGSNSTQSTSMNNNGWHNQCIKSKQMNP